MIHYDPLTPTSYLTVLAPADGWRVLILRVSNSHPTKSRGEWHTWWIHHKCCVSLYHCSDYASWERSHHFKFRSILDFTVTMGSYVATLVSNPTITVAKYRDSGDFCFQSSDRNSASGSVAKTSAAPRGTAPGSESAQARCAQAARK